MVIATPIAVDDATQASVIQAELNAISPDNCIQGLNYWWRPARVSRAVTHVCLPVPLVTGVSRDQRPLFWPITLDKRPSATHTHGTVHPALGAQRPPNKLTGPVLVIEGYPQARQVLAGLPFGCGKSFLACALSHVVIRQGHTALYLRTPRLLDDLALGRADGRYARTLSRDRAAVGVLVLDDFCWLWPPSRPAGDLLGGRGGPLLAALDGRREPAAGRQVAPLDGRPHVGRCCFGPRSRQTAHRITLKGASMRKRLNWVPARRPIMRNASRRPAQGGRK